jgi:T1SS-143 domain-containing protein
VVGSLTALHLHSNGDELNYVVSNNGTLLTAYTGSDPASHHVFTVSLSDADFGSYSFTLLDNLDHPAGHNENNITLDLGFVARDSDGDPTSSSFSVTINDDTPVAGPGDAATVNEPDLTTQTGFDQSFDHATDTASAGFVDGGQYGALAIYHSGDNGIVTKSGSGNYAVVTGTDGAPFTRFDGYDSTFDSGFKASVDIYLDPSKLAAGEGFDYSVAVNDQAGNHLRDFIFHVTKDASGKIFLGASNNTGFDPQRDLGSDPNHGEVAAGGWYTFEENFYDAGDGTLAVDLIVRDAHGVVVFSQTLNDTDDLLSTVVGGHRYGWFTNVDVDGGIAIDNVSLTQHDDATSATSVSGSLHLAAGADGLGSLTFAGITDGAAVVDSANHAVTSGHQAVYYHTVDSHTVVGSTQSGQVIFTVTLDPATGNYSFVLEHAIDHPVANVADSLGLKFGYTVTDGDGDTASSNFTVTVNDDLPVVAPSQASITVDEEGLGGNIGDSYGAPNNHDAATSSATASGTLSYSFGADGASATADIAFSTANLTALHLKSAGLELSYLWDQASRTLTGSTTAGTVFTLHVDNVATGDFTFTQSKPLDHPVAGSEDDITIPFNFTVTDGDADQSSGTVKVIVNDDAPVLVPQTLVSIANGEFTGAGDFTAPGSWSHPYGGIDADGALTGWTYTASAVNGATLGQVQLERVDSGYAGAMSSNSSPMVDLEASPGNIQISQIVTGLSLGEKLLVSFEIGEANFGNAKLAVLWDGVVVGTFDPHSGQMQLESVTVTAAGSSGTLTFQEIGVSGDSTGTFLTNVTAQQIAGSVDEGGLNVPALQLVGNDPGAATVATGSLAPLVHFGADGPSAAGGFTLVPQTDGDATSFVNGLHLSSLGSAVDHATLSGNTLTATAHDGHNVFTLTVNGDGAWTFTLLAPLDDAHLGEDTITIDFSSQVKAVDFDGDAISLAPGSFSVAVVDDVPVVSGPASGSVTENGSVAELTNGSFEGDSLATGAPGVTTDARGNYTYGASTGWTIIGGAGGLFAPVDAISNTSEHSGGNVVWLREGATLAQNTGSALAAGDVYAVHFNLGDRTDQSFPGGTVRLIAFNGVDSYVLSSLALPTPADGHWTTVDLSTGQIPSAYAGYQLRVEIQNGDGTGNQILIDNVEVDHFTPAVAADSLNIHWGADDVAALHSVVFNGTPDASGLTSNGQPLHYVLSNGGMLLSALAPDGHPVFTVALSAAGNGAYTFTLLDNLDHQGSNGAALPLDFAFKATDADGDSTNGNVHIAVNDQILTVTPVPLGDISETTVNTANSNAFVTQTIADHSLGINWGADDANPGTAGIDRTVAFTTTTAPANLTSNGYHLEYIVSADGTTLTAYRIQDGLLNGVDGRHYIAAGGGDLGLSSSYALDHSKVFSVTLSDTGNGNYTFTLFDNLDHTGVNDTTLPLNFDFVAKDADGDLKPGSFGVNVEDTAPTLGTAATATVTETGVANFAHASTKSLGIDWNADEGAAKQIVFLSQPTGLKSDGVDLAYQIVADGDNQRLIAYKVGDPNFTPVFTVAFTEANPTYTFTLFHNLDHAPGSDPLSIPFSIRAFDSDGDFVDQTFSVTVTDDVPTANNVTGAMSENETTVITLHEGTDFSFGADQHGAGITLGAPTISGAPVGANLTAPAVVLGPDGHTITVTPGTAFDSLAEGETAVLHIPYTVTDGDTDTITKDIAITITGNNDTPVINEATSVLTGSVTEAGDLLGIDEAGVGGPLHLTAALSAALALPANAAVASELAGLATNPADVHNTLGAIESALSVDVGTAIAIVWQSLDAAYVEAAAHSLDVTSINEAFTRLGVEYAAYVKAGGTPLVDVVAKYTADNDHNGSPDRLQSLHDNLLGNLTSDALTQRYGTTSLHDTLQALVVGVDADLLSRPYASGNQGNGGEAAGHLFDVANGFVTTATGTLVATDADHNATQSWSGNATGTYGTFAIDASTGQWTYTLDNSLAATQALKQGENPVETFTATVTDDHNATDTVTVQITVHGSNDAPVIGATSVVTGSVTEAGDLPGIHEAGLGGGLTLTAALSAALALPANAAVASELAGLATHPADVHNTLGAIESALNVDVGTAIAIVWQSLDAAYVEAAAHSLDVTSINEAFTRLGVEYAAYVKAGGTPLVDVVAKYTSDNDHNGSPDRLQSLHDNLLGNLTSDALTQRYGTTPLHDTLQGLVTDVDADLLIRPYASGNQGNASGAAAHAFDIANGFVTTATGMLVATDVDHDATHAWSGSAAGTYGTFAIDASSGHWTYTLDNSLAATQALAQGDSPVETFLATVTDDHGAVDTVNVKITVHGTNDAPVISVDTSNADHAFLPETNAGLITNGTLTVSDVDVTDAVHATVLSVSAGGSGIENLYTNAFLLGLLNVAPDPVLDANGARTGQLTWTFDSHGEAFDFLPNGWESVLNYTVQVSDGHGGIDTHVVQIKLHGTNDAPVITGAEAVGTIQEDPSSNPGTTVAALLGGNASDVDGTVAGIAVSGQSSTGGHWEYSTNGGGSWNTLATDAAHAEVLGLTSLVRFVPGLNVETDTSTSPQTQIAQPTLTFHAWDGTSGNIGDVVDLTVANATGGTSAYSAATATSSLTITDVVDHVFTEGNENINLHSFPNNPAINANWFEDGNFLNALGGDDIVQLPDVGDALYTHFAGQVFDAGAGNDSIIGGTGDDHIRGGEGNDSLSGNGGSDILEGGAGDDFLSGGANDDRLFGGADNDQLSGGTGNDFLQGDAGNDTLTGGSGVDTANYATNLSASNFSYNTTQFRWQVDATAGGEGTDVLHTLEVVTTPAQTFLLVGGNPGDTGFATISDAVAFAATLTGPVTILIAPGIYHEQVTIDGLSNLTLQSVNGPGTVTIEAPAGALAVTGHSDHWNSDVRAVVTVSNGSNVNINGITIDGDYAGDRTPGSNGDQITGIAYLHASGSIDHVVTEQTSNSPGGGLFGLQHGAGILADNGTGTQQSLTISNSTVQDFQKTGILIWNAAVDIHDNQVIGIGATNLTAQNDMQIGGSQGSIGHNEFSGVGYTGGTWSSTDLIAYLPTGALTIDGNTFKGTGVAGASTEGIDLSDVPPGTLVTLINNQIGTTGHGLDYGIFAYSDAGSTFATDPVISGNTFADIAIKGVYFDPELGGTFTTTVSFHQTGSQYDDVLAGSGGNDVLSGGDGNDVLEGRGGSDTIHGDGGNDTIILTADITDAGAYGPRTLDLGDGHTMSVSLAGLAGTADTVVGGTGGDNIVLDQGSSAGFVYDAYNSPSVITGVEQIEGSSGNDIIALPAGYTSDGGAGVTIHGNGGGDTVTASAAADTVDGGAGNDLLAGMAGDDILIGGATADSGADRLIGGSGSDTLYGNLTDLSVASNKGPTAGEDDRAIYGGSESQYDVTFNAGLGAWQVTAKPGAPEYDAGGHNTDTLYGIEGLSFDGGTTINLDLTAPVQLFDAGNHLLATFAHIQDAVNAATDNAGQYIVAGAGTYIENVTIDRSVELRGAHYGQAGDAAGRGIGETVIQGTVTVTATTHQVTIDGVEILNTTDNVTQFNGLTVSGGADVSVAHNLFYSQGSNGESIIVDDRGIYLTTGATGHVAVTGNDFSGSATGKYSGANWSRGVWSDGNEATLDVSHNTFEHVRSAINLDSFDNATTTISGNTVSDSGTAISIGVGSDSNITAITGNNFHNVDQELNLHNLTTPVIIDASATVSTFTDAAGDGAVNDSFYITGGSNDDKITGTAYGDTIETGGGNDKVTGGGGNDLIVGGAGTDQARYAATTLTADKFSFDATTQTWVVTTGTSDGTDHLQGVEIATDSGNHRFLLVGGGGFAHIQDAIDAALPGDTILIAPGTYTESHTTASGAAGLYINTANLTLLGFSSHDGQLITSAIDAQNYGPIVISGAENNFGANHWIDAGGTGTIISGLHLEAGSGTTNKLLEITADNVTISHDFIDVNNTSGYTGAAAIYLDEGSAQITKYLIDGNILNDGIYVASGVGTAADGISSNQKITNNSFVGTFDGAAGTTDMVAVQGQIPGIGWQQYPAEVPAISGNTSSNSVPFLFRMTEANPALFPSAAEVADIVAHNTTATSTYAYVLNSLNGLETFTQNPGPDEFHRFYVANSIDTLNLGVDATPDSLYGGQRITMVAGDQLIVQSGAAAVNSTIVADGLTVIASANSADLNLTLGISLPDTTPVTVRSITLGDYDTVNHLGANVDVTGNNQGDTIVGNSGNNTISGGTGNDTITGGRGADVVHGGAGNDTFVYTVGDGADIVDGGSDSNGPYPAYDVLNVVGDATARTFTIAAAAGGTDIDPTAADPLAVNATDIVVSYTGPGAAIVRADEIERVVVTLGSGGDTVVIQDVTGTAIAPDTIVINGGTGNDTLDLSQFQGNVHIVFDGHGGNDTLNISDFDWKDSTVTQTAGGYQIGIGGHLIDVAGVESFQFANGLTLTGSQLINIAPTLADASFSVTENTAGNTSVGFAAGSDQNGAIDSVQYAFVSNGTASLVSSDGKFVIDAASGEIKVANGAMIDYEATHALAETVRVTDTHGASTDHVYTIAVNDQNDVAPTITPVTLTAIAEDSGERIITQTELLSHASDVDSPLLTAINLQMSSGVGSLIDNGNGTWTYTPAANDDTSVSFSYTVTDGSLTAAGSATLDITPVNDPPSITATTPAHLVEATSVDPGTSSASATLTLGDVDGTVTYSTGGWTNAGGGDWTRLGLYGTATLSTSTNTITYALDNALADSLAPGDQRTDSFMIAVKDNSTGFASTDVIFTIDGRNDAPVISGSLSATMAEGNIHTITVGELGEMDPDDFGAGLTYTVSAASHGTVLVNGVVAASFTAQDVLGGKVAFQHDGSEGASAGFSFTLADGGENGATAASGTFNLTVTPVDDGVATLTVSNTTHTATAPQVGDVLQASLGSDPDGGPAGAVTYQWFDNGNAIAVGTGQTYTVTANDVGHTITAKASYVDGQGSGDTAFGAATQTVILGDNLPVITGGTTSGSVTQGFSLTIPTGNLVTNGGFEQGQNSPTSLTGWSFGGNTGAFFRAGNPHIGVASAEADWTTGSLLTQTITTVIGATYSVDFWMMNETALSNNSTTVSANGVAIGTVSALHSPFVYSEWTYSFVATSTSTVLGFNFVSPDSPPNREFIHLDDVTVRTTVTPGIETTTGSITFTDADATDTHSVAVAPKGINYVGTFSATPPSPDSTGNATGEVDWTFTVSDTVLQSLTPNQLVTQTYTVTVDDGHGGTASQDVTVTIANPEHAPEFGNGTLTGTVTGQFNVSPTSALVNGSFESGGTGWTVASQAGGAGFSSNFPADGSGNFTANSFGNGTAVKTQLTQVVDTIAGVQYTLSFQVLATSSTPEGHIYVNWNGTQIDAIATGQTSGSYHTFTATVTGTGHDTLQFAIDDPNNNPATFDSWRVDAVSLTPALHYESTTGTIAFTDQEASDIHSVTVSTPAGSNYIGTFVPTVDDVNHQVKWTFYASDNDLQAMSGNTANQTYTLQISDGRGGFDTQDVTVTVAKHFNSAPSIISTAPTFSFTDDSSMSGANLVQNPTFEQPDIFNPALAPWTLTSGSVSFSGSGVDIDRVNLNANSAISQTLATKAGTSYLVTYYLENFGEPFVVSANGTAIDTQTGINGSWLQFSTTFTATSAATALGFASNGPFNGAALDKVSVQSAHVSTGTISFTDADVTDTHTVSAGGPTFVWSGGTLSSAQLSALTSASFLTLVETDSTGAGQGSVAWKYVITDDAIQFLKAGQTLTETYAVTINDGFTGGTATQNVTVTIAGDNTAPAAPSAPDLQAASDSGSSSTDNLTKTTTPTFTGSGAEAGATVKLYDTNGTTLLGSGVADGLGNWTITSSTLASGSHTLTAKQTDLAGNTGVASSALVVTIDTTASAPTGLALAAADDTGSSNSDAITKNTSNLTISGSGETGAIVTLFDDVNNNGVKNNGEATLGTVTISSGTSFSKDITTLGAGLHHVGAFQTDVAGNVSGGAVRLDINVDNTLPTVTAVTDNIGASSTNGAINFTVTFSEAVTGVSTSSFTVPNAAVTNVVAVDSSHYTVTVTPNAGLASAALSLNLIAGGAIDLAGNAAGAANLAALDTQNVDTTVPTVTSESITGATGIQNNYLNANDVVSITVNMSEVVNVTGTPQLALTIGSTTVQANYASGSGSSALVFTYTILANQTDNNGISINSNALSLNGGTIKDVAGNNATLAFGGVSDNASYMVDTTPPPSITISNVDISADSGTSASDFITNVAAQTITGTLSSALGGSNFLYGSVDGGSTWTNITSMVTGTSIAWTGATLSDGSHSIALKVTDAAGNDGGVASQSYLLDRSAAQASSVSNLISGGTFSINVTDLESGVASVHVVRVGSPGSFFDATLTSGTATNGTWTAGNVGSFDGASLSILLKNVAGTGTGIIGTGPAGVSGEAINLALTTPVDHVGAVSLTITGVLAGWTLSEGTQNADGTWSVVTGDPSQLSVISPDGYTGALVLQVTETWTNADGSTGMLYVSDNVEAYAKGAPIFAWSGDDTLSASSGDDTLVFANKIGTDVVHHFDTAHDKIDLIGFAGIASFADVLAHLGTDAAGNAIITLGDGQTITLNGVSAASLTANDFLFNEVPVTHNAGTMVISDGAVLPMSGEVDNTGAIQINSTGSETAFEIIRHGLTLLGGGEVMLSDSSENVIFGSDPSVTLTNVDNTISGAGQLGDGQLTLVNEGTINATGHNALVVDTGDNTIVNTGTMEATGSGGLVVHSDVANTGTLWANGGNLTLDGDVSGSGTARISGMGSLEIGGAFNERIVFDDSAAGTLKLDHPSDFSGMLSGFDGNDVLDLSGILGGSATFSFAENADKTGGVLSVTDGAHSANIAFSGQYNVSDFHISADSGNHALVHLEHQVQQLTNAA